MNGGTIRTTLAAAAAWTILAATPAAAQKGPRHAPPDGAEIAQQAKGKKLDDANRLVAEFQGQPIAYTPAADNASVRSLDELRGGRFLGVLDTKAAGDESGLPPGTYDVFVAEVDGRWRAFAEANGQVVREAARVRVVRAEKGNRRPGFGEKGWYISDPVCCVEPDPSLAYANTVALAPTPASVATGRNAQLTPTVYDANGRVLSGATVTWTSSNPAVATVNGTGVVQGVTAGTVTVAAASGTRKGTVTVNVTPPAVASVQVSQTSASIRIGEYLTLTGAALDDQGTPLADRPVTWSSSNYGVTKMYPATGGVRLLGASPGTATVTASSGGVSRPVSVTVATSCACTLRMSPTLVASLPVGAKQELSVYARGADGNLLPLGSSISYGSGSPAILRQVGASTDGTFARAQFEGAALGRANVVARLGDQISTAQVTVTGPVARLTLTPTVATIQARNKLQATATTFDAAGTQVPSGTLAWASSDPTVFVVSSTGLVTGANPGAATLSATTNGVEAYSAITVVPAPVATVTLTPASTQTGTGATLALTATLRDAAGNALTGRDVRWTTSSLAIASVDQIGIVTTGTVGNATITATSEGKSGTATVMVSAPSSPPDTTTTAVAVEIYW